MQPSDFEIIDRYISGQMTAGERAEFENRLQSDAGLQNKLEELQDLKEGIERQALRQLMDRFHSELKNKKAKRPARKFSLRRFAVAASIALLMGLGGYWVLENYGNRSERIFDRYFVPDPGLPTVMSSSGGSYVFSDAMVDYKTGEYSKAIEKWKTLLPDNPSGDTLNYFIGAAYLANGNESKAAEFLNTALAHSKGGLEKEIRFYLGMAYLKADSLQKAMDLLRESGAEESLDILKEIETKSLSK